MSAAEIKTDNYLKTNIVRVWCLTPLSTIFSYIVAVRFIGGGNYSDTEKTTDLSQVTDKLYHIMLYTSP